MDTALIQTIFYDLFVTYSIGNVPLAVFISGILVFSFTRLRNMSFDFTFLIMTLYAVFVTYLIGQIVVLIAVIIVALVLYGFLKGVFNR